MSMEFSVGRASQKSVAASFQALEPKGAKWHFYSWFAMAGNYLLMMFYTTISGWMLFCLGYMAKGGFAGLGPDAVGAMFGAHTASAAKCIIGTGSMAVFGSYIGKDRRLFGESMNITVPDTFSPST